MNNSFSANFSLENVNTTFYLETTLCTPSASFLQTLSFDIFYFALFQLSLEKIAHHPHHWHTDNFKSERPQKTERTQKEHVQINCTYVQQASLDRGGFFPSLHSFSPSCQCFSFVFYSHCHNRIFSFIAIFFRNKIIHGMCNCAWISIVKTQLFKSEHIWILIQNILNGCTRITHTEKCAPTMSLQNERKWFTMQNKQHLIISFEMFQSQIWWYHAEIHMSTSHLNWSIVSQTHKRDEDEKTLNNIDHYIWLTIHKSVT